MKLLSALAALVYVSTLHAADVPKVFAGLLEADTPIRGQIGVVIPPEEINKYVAKVEASARKNAEWFREYSEKAKPGAPLPYHENLGLTQEEYAEYLKLWRQREFKPVEEVMLLLRKRGGNEWSITATGNAGMISTLRYDVEKDVFVSPNGTLERIKDIEPDAESVLGAWSGKEWRLEEETTLGKTRENFAIGRFSEKEFGVIVYRAQELSSEGTRLLDRSVVLRFALGKAGHLPQEKR